MSGKDILKEYFPIILTIVGFFISHIVLSGLDPKFVSNEIKTSLSLVFTIQIYLASNWVKFEFFEWKKIKKIDSKFDKLLQSNSRTGIILDKFAKSNLILESLYSKVKVDLELDEKITIEKQNNQKDFYDYILHLKYNDFLSSQFVCSLEDKTVSKIPSHYFINMIWREFVDTADCYYSIQLLLSDNIKTYIEDKKRMHYEINHLIRKSNDINRTEIIKIFILEDDLFDENDKLCNGHIKDYLMIWNEKLSPTYHIMSIMVIKENNALGIIEKEGSSKLEDIGIFGDIYGRQTTNSTEKNDDKLDIVFFFDKVKTDKEKKNFKQLIHSSKMLNQVL